MKTKAKKDEDGISWRKKREIVDIDGTIYTKEYGEVVSLNIEETKLKEKFGKNVRRIRENIGISQEVLAFRAKLHRTYISDVERGKKNISLENIGKIAKALNRHIHTLMRF